MPFLSLNGLLIPVASEQMTRGFEENARVTRQATGQLSRDAYLAKRKWEITTRPMRWDESQLLISMLHYSPVWAFNYSSGSLQGGLPGNAITSSYAGNLYWSKGAGTDGVPVIGGARYGALSLAPAYNTTNLWSQIESGNVANGAPSGSVAGFSAVGGANLTSSNQGGYDSSSCLRVQAAGADAGFIIAPVSVVQNARQFASFYARAHGANVSIVAELFSGASLIASRTVSLSQTAWQRVALHGIAPASSNFTMRVRLLGAGAAFFDAFQLEPYARSPFWAGTRSDATTISYSVLDGTLGSTNGISISAWVTPSDTLNAAVFSIWDASTSARLSLRCNAISGTGAPLKLVCIEPNGQERTLESSGYTWPENLDWAHVVCVLSPVPRTPQMAIYINGALAGSASPGIVSKPENYNRLYVGNENGVYQWNAPMDNLVVYPYPLTQAGVAAVYSAGAIGPLTGDWPLMRASGDFLPGGGTAYVIASLAGFEVVQAAGASGATENYQILNLVLQED